MGTRIFNGKFRKNKADMTGIDQRRIDIEPSFVIIRRLQNVHDPSPEPFGIVHVTAKAQASCICR